MRKWKAAIFVPVFNEREKIGKVLEHVRDVCDDRVQLIIAADDGSTDGSADIAARHAHHVVRMDKNSGNGSTTRVALRYIGDTGSDWDAVIRIDGDGQHDPDFLPDVLDRLETDADVVVCSRFHPDSDVNAVPLDRRLLNSAMAHLIREVTGWPVTDARSGFLGFRWPAIPPPIIESLHTERYGIPMEMLLRVWNHDRRFRYKEIAHSAMYQLGISERLDKKYKEEKTTDKVSRMSEAFRVFYATCADIGFRF